MNAVTPPQTLGAQAAEPDTVTLLKAAAQAGSPITGRMLETFRADGLIPHPHRAGYRGRAPVWRYPPGTEVQLVALLRWRHRSKDPDLLKMLLWLDGFAIAPSAVRTALARQLQVLTQAVEREITGTRGGSAWIRPTAPPVARPSTRSARRSRLSGAQRRSRAAAGSRPRTGRGPSR